MSELPPEEHDGKEPGWDAPPGWVEGETMPGPELPPGTRTEGLGAEDLDEDGNDK